MSHIVQPWDQPDSPEVSTECQNYEKKPKVQKKTNI